MVRLLCSPKKLLLLVDSNIPISLLDMPIIKLEQTRFGSSYLPNVISHVLAIPAEIFEWIFGIKETLYFNIVANTEIVKR